MAAVGDGVAVVQGATETSSYLRFRQNNHFFYLTGVEVPRAIVVIDGRTKSATLYLPPRDERMERSEGPVLVPGDEAARLTGIAAVLPRDAFAAAVDAFARDGRTIYTPHRPESLGGASRPRRSTATRGSRRRIRGTAAARARRPFVGRLKAKAPQAKVEDLDPILDRLRLIKSPREIAAIREATRVAGLGILEAMKQARPGLKERELAAVADYVFTQARRAGRRLLRARRHRQERALPALPRRGVGAAGRRPGALRLRAGHRQLHLRRDADVPGQRPLHALAARDLHRLPALLPRADGRVKPAAPARQVHDAAAVKMTRDRRRRRRSAIRRSRRRRSASSALFGSERRARRSATGSAWRSTTSTTTATATCSSQGWSSPSSPRCTIPDDRVYVRLEDVIVITETGYENLSASCRSRSTTSRS